MSKQDRKDDLMVTVFIYLSGFNNKDEYIVPQIENKIL